jgi:putative membrane protein
MEALPMKRIGLTALALTALLTAGCSKNDRTTTANNSPAVGTAGRSDSKVSAGDRDFIKDVTQANLAELDLARAAADKSTTPDVKQFAQRMVTDHTTAGDKLNAIASENAVTVDSQLDDRHRDLREKLLQKQGLEFDRDYMDAMVDEHQKLVDKLESRIDKDTLSKWKTDTTAHHGAGEKARVEGKAQMVVPEKSDDMVTQRVNAWAAETYPTAYAHLESAKALRDTVKKRSTN